MLARLMLALLLLSATALGAAGQVQQGGTITPKHGAMWSTKGVIADSGPATNGNLTELGITGRGSVFCTNSDRAPTPYVQFCINVDPANGVSFLDQSIGGSAHVPLKFIVNGFTALTLTDTGFTLGGALGVTSGGTGLTALTAGSVLVGNGTSAASLVAPGTAGNVLTSNGSAWVSSAGGGGGGGGGTVTNVGTGTGLIGGNITTSGTISFATVPTATLLANISGITAAPVPVTLSAALDNMIGVTRGGLLARGLTGWTALVPTSTPGQALLSGGIGADPAYGNVVNTLSSTSGITLSSAAGNVAINLGPIPNNTLMGNISGSSAAAIGISPSQLFDSAFGSTQGDLIVRTGGGWTALVPGASGQVLQTLGAGLSPQWVTVSGTGTVTSLTCGSGLSGGTITGSGTCSISAPVVVSLGGTGATTLAAFGVLVGEGTGAVHVTNTGNLRDILASNGGGSDPAFFSMPQVLDDKFGSVQGNLLYRNATTWIALPPGSAGQVLQTGGAAANPSWASVAGTGTVTSVTAGAGLTGGTFTSSGTIAIASPIAVTIGGTGATTLTAHGVLLGEGTGAVVATAAGAASSVLTGNGAADPSFVTLSALIDAALTGTAQGNVLYRGASAWTVLPPGTNGQFLRTQGAGANPIWATGSGTGSVTSVATGTGLTGGPITTTGTVALTVPVVVTSGGTGATTLTAHGVLVGEGTGAVAATAAGTAGQVLTSGGASADPTWSNISVHGSQLGVQVFTTPGSSTYTPTSGTNSIIVECLGAGGAGGGTPATGSTQLAAGAGGASGSYSRSNISAGFSGVTIVIGQGGTGISALAGNGGGASSFGSILTCPGGGGGPAGTLATTANITNRGVPGLLATGGNISNSAGVAGVPGVVQSGTQALAGTGGPSVMGGGGTTVTAGATGATGNAAGAGGGGSFAGGSVAAQIGGGGGNGTVIVYEFN